MERLAFVVPGRLDQLTGGYLFDRRIVEGLRGRDRNVHIVELENGGALAELPDGLPAAVDGLALPLLETDLPQAAKRLRLVAFVHHPLAEETGLPHAEAARLAGLERRLLPLFRGVLCPSHRTAAAVASLDVAPARIAVTPPGTEKPDRLAPLRGGPVRKLLCIANVIPRKGYDVLVAALAQLGDLDWNLDIIGSLDRDPAAVAVLRRQIAAAGLTGRIALLGEQPPEGVARAYMAADGFVLASHHEGYGMVCAEAMAHGLPQVTTTAGAIPEVVPPEAGLLVPPADPAALAAALRRLIAEPGLAASLAAGARRAAALLPDWNEAVTAWETAFRRLAALRMAGSASL